MAKEKFVVTGNQRDEIDGQMLDIKRQLRLKNGSPLDPGLVKSALQLINEGSFPVVKNILSGIIHSSYVYKQNDFWLCSERFVENTGNNERVKIRSITKEFSKDFLSLSDRVNAPYFIKGRILRADIPTRKIISEIKKEAGSLLDGAMSGIYGLMKKNHLDLFMYHGFTSEGLSMENSNIFFAKSVSSEIRQVILRWDKNGGWIVDSKSLIEEIEPGSRIFYCISDKH